MPLVAKALLGEAILPVMVGYSSYDPNVLQDADDISQKGFIVALDLMFATTLDATSNLSSDLH